MGTTSLCRLRKDQSGSTSKARMNSRLRERRTDDEDKLVARAVLIIMLYRIHGLDF